MTQLRQPASPNQVNVTFYFGNPENHTTRTCTIPTERVKPILYTVAKARPTHLLRFRDLRGEVGVWKTETYLPVSALFQVCVGVGNCDVDAQFIQILTDVEDQ